MATVTLKIVGDVKSATDGVKQVTASVAGLEKVAGSVTRQVTGLVAGFLSFQAVEKVISTIITNTLDAERAQVQLMAVLKSTGGAAGFTATELNKMAKSLQSVTTFEDDAVTAAQTVLLQFTKLGRETFPRAMQATADLAARMGTDLPAAAQLLGRAMNDPETGLRGLRQAGVSLSDAQKELIKDLLDTGQAAKAQTLVLELLEKSVGGAAAATRNSLGGALAALKVTIGNLLEGGGSLEGMRKAVEAVNTALMRPEVQRGFQQMVTALLNLLPTVVQAFGAVVEAIAAVGPYMELLTGLLETGIKIGVAYYALYVTLPAVYLAMEKALRASVAAMTAQNTSMLTSIKSAGLLKAAGGLVLAAWSGWEIGTQLRDQFIEVKLAGLALVEGLLIGWERLKQGTSIAWEYIKMAATAVFNVLKAELALLINAFATFTEFSSGGLASGIVADMRAYAATLQPAKSAAEGLEEAVAKINTTFEANRKTIQENTQDLADFYIEEHAAKQASEELAEGLEPLVTGLEELETAAELTEEQMKELEKALSDLRGIVLAQAKVLGDDATKAALNYAEGMLKVYEIEQKLVALNKLDAAAVLGLSIARRQLGEIYKEEVDTITERLTAGEQLLADMDEEIDLLGLSTEAMVAEELVRRAINDAIADKEPLSEEEIANLRREVTERLKVINTLKLQKDQEEDWLRLWEGFGASAADAFANFAVEVVSDFDHIGDSFEDLGDSLVSMTKRMVSQMISEFLRLRVVNPMINSALGSSLPTGGGGFGAGAGMLGGLGSLLGPAALLYAGASSGNPGQGALYGGAAGALFASGTIGAGFIGGTALAGGVSAATGAALGSVVPIIGTVIGALVGAIAAYYMKEDPPAIDVIGRSVVGTDGYRNLSPGSTYGSALGGFTFASIDSVDRESRDAIGGAITDFDNTIAQLLDQDQLARVTTALSEFNLHLEEGAISAENILGARFEAILSTFDENIQEVVRGAGDLQAQVQKLGELLTWPKAIRDLLDSFKEADMLAGMTELERQIYEVNEQFDAARMALEAMEASQEELAELEEYRIRVLNRLSAATDQANRATSNSAREVSRLATALLPIGRPLVPRPRPPGSDPGTGGGVDPIADDLAAAATAARALAEAMLDASRGVQDWLNQQRFGELSTLTPEQQFEEAQRQFQSLLGRARNNDIDAIRGLPNAAQTLLELGRSYLSSGDEYTTLEAAIREALTPFGALASSNNPSYVLANSMATLGGAFNTFAEYLRDYNERQLALLNVATVAQSNVVLDKATNDARASELVMHVSGTNASIQVMHSDLIAAAERADADRGAMLVRLGAIEQRLTELAQVEADRYELERNGRR